METNKENKLTVFSIMVAVILVALIVYAFMAKIKQSDDQMIDIKTSDDASYLNEEVSNNQEQKIENMETENTNERVSKNGDVLVMNYTGKLADGTVFDSNVDPKFNHVQPFEFTLGAGMVIKGWDEGLVGMKVGEKKTLTIAPEKGYGERGAGALIPPNATLIFDVELVGIK